MAEPVRLSLRVAVGDFNHDLAVPPSAYLRWALEARMEGFRNPPMSMLLADASVMVKAQVVRVLVPKSLMPGMSVVVTQSPHSIGRTSFTLRYSFHVDGVLVAEALTVMVKVGDVGAMPLPAWLHTDLPWDVPPTSDVSVKPKMPEDLVVGSTALDAFLKNVGPLKASHDVLTRPSDEDMQKHVMHSRTVQFFEDCIALQARPVPDVLYVDYVAQLKHGTPCQIKMAENSPVDTKFALLMFLQSKEDSSRPISRAYAMWNTPSIDNM